VSKLSFVFFVSRIILVALSIDVVRLFNLNFFDFLALFVDFFDLLKFALIRSLRLLVSLRNVPCLFLSCHPCN